MRKAILILPFVLSMAAAPAFAGGELSIHRGDTVSHSGGCRKDSPQGKCCHAGSKPYHCH
jgi:hypothetical protein